MMQTQKVQLEVLEHRGKSSAGGPEVKPQVDFEIKAYYTRFERQGGLFGPHLKNCFKSCLLHPNHLKLDTKHLCTLTKTSTLAT